MDHVEPQISNPDNQQTLEEFLKRNYEQINGLMFENRNQSAQVRCLVTSLANKIDLLINQIAQNSLKSSERNGQMGLLFDKFQEENLFLRDRIQILTNIFEANMEKWKIDQMNVRNYEQKMLVLLNENNALKLRFDSLNENNNELVRKLRLMENKVAEQEITIRNHENHSLVCKHKKTMNPKRFSNCREHIQKLMENCFRDIRRSYRSRELYSGKKVISTLAPKFIQTTYDITSFLNSELISVVLKQ